MKLIAILTFAGCLHISAATFSQQITIAEKRISIESALKAIEKQTNYSFFYQTELFDQLPYVQVNLKNATISQALSEVLKNQPVTYKIVDNIISISSKNGSNAFTDQPVTGVIKDNKGNPLPGVSVAVKNTRMVTMTDQNGAFRIVADEKAVLIITAISYKKIEVPVNSRTTINITLEEAVSDLDQVVVIGYGNQSRGKLTSSISKVKSSDLNRYSGANFAQQLAGKAAGVVINDASAQPGTDPQIIIRGIGTLTAGGLR